MNEETQKTQENQAPNPNQKSACEGPGDEAWDIYEAMFD